MGFGRTMAQLAVDTPFTICIVCARGEVAADRPRWVAAVPRRVRDRAIWGRVRFTYKARREIAEIGWDRSDACEVLASLGSENLVRRLASEHSGEWLYVFECQVAGMQIYAKVILRVECIVISFHEESSHGAEKE